MLRNFLFLLFLSCAECDQLQLPEGAPCSRDGVNGKCVKIYRCFSTIEDMKNKNFPPICSYQNKVPIVCCTDCDLVNDTRLLVIDKNLGILTKSRTSKAKNKCVDYTKSINYLPCKNSGRTLIVKSLNEKDNCHDFEPITQRYYFAGAGGRDALRYEFSHMALLGYGETLDSANWLCGGSIISEKFILTAAHCVATKSLGPVKYVAVGILRRTDRPEIWQRYNVTRIIPHPEYKPPSKYNDIALLEIDANMSLNKQRLQLIDQVNMFSLELDSVHNIFKTHCRCSLRLIALKNMTMKYELIEKQNREQVLAIRRLVNSCDCNDEHSTSLTSNNNTSCQPSLGCVSPIPVLCTQTPQTQTPTLNNYVYSDSSTNSHSLQFYQLLYPACLHTDDEYDEKAQATGWGALGHKKELADVLQAVPLNRFSEEECSEYYPPHRHLVNGLNHTTQMCYGDKAEPKDTCEGDSGGPLQSATHERCMYTILGVTSYGRKCGVTGGSGVYTRVKPYVPWIESIVWP